MTRSLSIPLLAGLLTAAAAGADDPFAKEYTRAEGTWVVTEMHMNGEELGPDSFKGMKIVLAGDKVTAYVGDEVIAEGKYKVVGVKEKEKRVEFDLTMSGGPDKGKTFPALNEWVDADTLRTCIAQPGKPRPKGFMTEKGDRQALFVIKRSKK
jgi:uncharacterized protein (TIGR03067 family)